MMNLLTNAHVNKYYNSERDQADGKRIYINTIVSYIFIN